MRAPLHYVATAIIIPIYGIQVCPFIDSLPVSQVVIPVLIALSLQYGLRTVLTRTLIKASDLKVQASRTFFLELGLFIASAIGLMVFNTLAHDFPLASGLKVLVGVAGLGFFAAVDLGLASERAVVAQVEATGRHLELDANYFPLSRKTQAFAAVSTLVLISVFMLLVIKDLDWIVDVGDTVPLDDARISIIKEFLFVLAVVLPHALNIIRSFSANLNVFLRAETRVLRRVTEGDYTPRVPVGSNDEFGHMAQGINTMVARIAARTEELNRTRDVTILSLATLAETRDNETGAHILRTQRYVRVLSEQLKTHPRFSAFLDADTIDLLYKSAPLHDIGKVGIPDAILLKPGKLSDAEFEIMKTHAQLGADALKRAEQGLGETSFLRHARDIAETHHEKWDGSGYPCGLKGEDIPISGRLMAVADVYDALISARVYKPAFPHEKAMGILREGAGAHFDPDVIDALDTIEDQFIAIAAKYGDQHTEAAQ